MKKLRMTLTMAVVAAGLMALHIVPASAAAGGGAAVVGFAGDATLPVFPSPTTEQGDFNGKVIDNTDDIDQLVSAADLLPTQSLPAATSAAVGVTNTSHHVVDHALESGTVTSTNFDYNEPIGCAAGTASGPFEVDTANTNVQGDFQWARVGATAAIVLTNVDATDKEVNELFIDGGVGAGTAVFTVAEPEVVCDPTSGSHSITAHVLGAAAVTGVS